MANFSPFASSALRSFPISFVFSEGSIFLTVGNKLKRFFPRLDTKALIASGSAAGIAAAFNTPLRGIVFAVEELVGEHFTRVRSSMLIAVIIAGMVAQALVGSYLMFGSPHLENPT
ncbi:MAG: chloride channel protein [Chitinophagaceae bacterium]|nr:chloride channel protein [Oligoflexus sp.]